MHTDPEHYRLQPGAEPKRRARGRSRALAVLVAVGLPAMVGVDAIGAAVTSAEAAPNTVFAHAVPANPVAYDPSSVELGVEFQTSTSGVILGLRYYAGAHGHAPVPGSLWASNGSRLGRTTFTAASAAGWQEARFNTPIPVKPMKTYTASYLAAEGFYAADQGYFSGGSFTNGPLTARKGRYSYTSTGAFPTYDWRGTNYYVDVLFVASGSSAAPAPTTTTTLAPAPTTTTTLAPAPTTTTTLAPAPTTTTTLAPAPTTTTTLAPAPTTTTTLPPAPTGSSTWPGATNTGVPAGTVLTPRAGFTASVAGAVYDGLDISGPVSVTANNVTIKRSRIRDGQNFTIVRVKEGVTGFVMEDCELDGLGGTNGANGVYGSVTMRRCNVHGVENGLNPLSNSVIEDSWIHDLRSPGEPHYDGIQMDGNQSNIVIRHNTISVPNQTGAIMIDNYFGPINNVTVDNNRLMGGTYTLYVDGQFSGGAILNVTVTNNRFGTSQFGYALIRNVSVSQSGNLDDATGRLINLS